MGTQSNDAPRGWAAFWPWIRALASVLGGRSLAAAAAFLSNVLVLLQLGPSVFGAFYLLFNVMSLVAGLTGPAIDTSLVRFAVRHKDDSGDGSLPYFKLVFWLKCAVCGLTLLVGVALAWVNYYLGGGTPAGVGPWAVVLAFFGGAAVSMWGFAQSYFLSHEMFTRFAGYEFFSSLLRLGLVMALMVFGVMHPVAYLGVYVAAPLIMGVLSWSELPGKVFTAPTSMETAVSFYHFGKWVILASFFTTLAQRLDVLVLRHFETPLSEIGLYGAAIQMMLAGELVLLTFHSVLLPKASAMKDPAYLRIFIGRFRIPSMMFGVALIFMVPILQFLTRTPGHVEPGTPWALIDQLPAVPQYAGASSYFTILIVGVIVTIASSPAIVALYGLGHSGMICAFEGVRLVLTFALGVYLAREYGALGMAWAVTVVRAGVSIVGYLIAHRWVKMAMIRSYAEDPAS